MNQALVQMHKRYIDQSSEEATAVTDLVAFADGITWEVCVTRDMLYCGPCSVLLRPRCVLFYAWPAARWHRVGPRVHGRTLRTLPGRLLKEMYIDCGVRVIMAGIQADGPQA